jgi:RNA polymerase sigma-70 factor, ECF subfamily
MVDGRSRAGQKCVTLEQIYRKNFRFVWRALGRLGVPERDLADAVQDVFVVVHRRLADFEGRSRIETWLYGICMRVASDRRRLASSRHELFGVMPERSDDAATVTDAIERREGLALLEQILDGLPLEQRAVFTLFEIDAEPCERISELLALPLGTVYSRLRLARAAFRKRLAQIQSRESFRLGARGSA